MSTQPAPSTLRTAAESAIVTRRLQELHRRSTRYEVLSSIEDGPSFLLCYSLPLSRGHLLEKVLNGDQSIRLALIRLGNITDSSKATYSRSGGWQIGKLRVHMGRTERTAILEGECEPIDRAVAWDS